MPKAILEFTLPEEQEEHRLALDGLKYLCVLQELDDYLSNRIEYGEYPAKTKNVYAEVRGLLYQYANGEGVSIRS